MLANLLVSQLRINDKEHVAKRFVRLSSVSDAEPVSVKENNEEVFQELTRLTLAKFFLREFYLYATNCDGVVDKSES